jgi:hypothetical protein
MITLKRRAVRRADTQTAVQRQVQILKSRGAATRDIDQPHRLAKHHALSCGKPRCFLCSNPRYSAATKGRARLTRQELRALDIATMPFVVSE